MAEFHFLCPQCNDKIKARSDHALAVKLFYHLMRKHHLTPEEAAAKRDDWLG